MTGHNKHSGLGAGPRSPMESQSGLLQLELLVLFYPFCSVIKKLVQGVQTQH